MTQDDVDNGRMICLIGIAPLKPAEFVIFRISQKMPESSAARFASYGLVPANKGSSNRSG